MANDEKFQLTSATGGDRLENRLGRLEIVFTRQEALPLSEVTDYLRTFRATYAAIIDEKMFPDLTATTYPTKHIGDLLTAHLKAVQPKQVGPWRSREYAYYRTDLGSNELLLESITHESPYTVTLMGLLPPLIAIVGLCAGELEVSVIPPKLHIKCNKSLGQALSDLKRAWRK